MTRRLGNAKTVAAALAVVTVVIGLYLPITNGGFIWDDRIFLHDDAQLRHGDSWIRAIFHVTFDAENYFRPLVMAFFVAEMKVFNSSAWAMHAVSLGLHALNVLLIGATARVVSTMFGPSRTGTRVILTAMLIYGLHPLLIEPIAWISCQLELLLTFLFLLGLLSHLTIRNPWIRAAAVSACFFLAACTKEAAIAFPLLLLVVDWLRLGRSERRGNERVSTLLPAYIAMLLAGVGYLALRSWGLGYVLAPSSVEALGPISRLQLVCLTYLTYWRQIVWPMDGINPVHLASASRIAEISSVSLATDVAALALFVFGLQRWIQRLPAGGLIIGATTMLLPVLHILPIAFEDSFYHDHFAMTATAIAAVFLPATVSSIHIETSARKRLGLVAYGVCAVWLLASAFNIRVTIPLWSDETRLWQWALHDNPDSLIARDNLFAMYLQHGDLERARPMAASFLAEDRACLNCMLNVAQLAILDRDPTTADRAMERAQRAMRDQRPTDRQMVNYVAKIGDTRRLLGDLAGAEAAYRDAISLDPQLSMPRLSLATTLALQGKIDEARSAADEGLALLTPDQQARSRLEFAQFLEKVATHDPAN